MKNGKMSVREQLEQGDWSGMTVREIGAALGRKPETVRRVMQIMREETGQEVPHIRVNPVKFYIGGKEISMEEALTGSDWSDLTVTQIAEVLDTTPAAVYNAIGRYRKKTGREIPHARGTWK